jgi:radical SAM superfamily enzyme YgiQ (UPF0313 family)
MILINPGYNRKQKLGGFSRYVPLSVPIGIGYLAGYLIKHGKPVEIIDEEIVRLDDRLLDECIEGLDQPYIFGISCLTAGIARGHEVAAMIKAKHPKSIVIFGNVHPTVLPEDVLNDRNVDIVVRGEAEESLNALYESLKNNKDYAGIKGMSFRRGGQIVHNENAELPDLKNVPGFPYHLFERYADRYELGFVASSRGCPYNCMFCSQRSISGRKYRFFPSEVVVESLDQLINKYGRRNITFVDDSFLVNKDRVVELCGMIRSKGLNKGVIFDCQARGDTVDEDILNVLKSAGFRTIHFGVETASERLMKMIDKNETIKEIEDGIRLAKRLGFRVSGTFILGLPTETEDERKATYTLANRLSLDYVRFNNATPYPGTRLYEVALKEKRFNPGKDWENLNACGTLVESPFKNAQLAYVPLTTSETCLRRDILQFNLFYSFNPWRIYKILKERVGPAGWLALPERWYLRPEEWFYLIKFGTGILLLFAKVFFYNAVIFLEKAVSLKKKRSG